MSSRVEYAAARRTVAGLVGAGAAFAAFAYAESTPAGRFLLGVAALVCVGEGVRCALVRPVLAADERGIEIALATRRVGIPWSRVERVTCDVERRRGATARSVLVDLGESVHSVPAYRLGAPPAEVVSGLEAARPR